MGKLSNRAENDTFLGTGSELGICRRGAWRISSSFSCHVTCFFYIFFSRYLFCLSPPSGRSSLFICDRHPVVSCNPHHSRTHRTLIINRVWWTRKNQKSLSPDRWLGPYASTPLYSCDLLGEWNRETIYSSPAMRRTNACKFTIFNDGPGGAWIIQRTAATTLALLILEMSFLNWRRRSNYEIYFDW